MARMAAMVEVAEQMDLFLQHENEAAIYGATPAGVKDIFATLGSDRLLGVFDPANYVVEAVKPFDEGWQVGLADLTDHIHIKDAIRHADGSFVCVPAGEGQGQFPEIFADLKTRDFSGVMTMEPHLSVIGQYSGFTGPDLFGKACDTLKAACDTAGISYR